MSGYEIRVSYPEIRVSCPDFIVSKTFPDFSVWYPEIRAFKDYYEIDI